MNALCHLADSSCRPSSGPAISPLAPDAALAARFKPLADTLAANEAKINAELLAAQGKPVDMGGSLGRTEATGYGVIFAVREAMKHLKLDPKASVAAWLHRTGQAHGITHNALRKECGGPPAAVANASVIGFNVYGVSLNDTLKFI